MNSVGSGEASDVAANSQIAATSLPNPLFSYHMQAGEKSDKKNIWRAGPDIVDMIRFLAPFSGGNDELRALHALDIVDKHRALLPVATVAIHPDIAYSDDQGGSAAFIGNTSWPARDGFVFFRLPPARNVTIGQEFNATGEITFGEHTYFGARPIVPTLRGLEKRVTGIIMYFVVLKRMQAETMAYQRDASVAG